MALDFHKRSNGVGGSELCAILGMSEYATAVDVWLLKTGRVDKFEGNQHTKRGHRLEPVVAQYLQDELAELGASVLTAEEFALLGIELPSGAKLEDSDTIVHPLHSFMVGSPDRYVLFFEDGKLCGGELKTTLSRIHNEVDVFEKAISWVFQSQYYMMLTGLKRWYIAWIYLPTWDFYYTEIEYSQEMADIITEEVDKFWNYNVLLGIAPEPATADDVVSLYPNSDGDIEASDALADEIYKYASLKSEEKCLAADIARSKEKIALSVLGYENIKYKNRVIATFKTQSATRINADLFKELASKELASKELVEQCSSTTKTRVLRLKKEKKQ